MWIGIWRKFGDNVYLRLAGYDDETFIAVMFGYFDLISDLVDESHKMDFYSFISRHVHIQRLVCDRLTWCDTDDSQYTRVNEDEMIALFMYDKVPGRGI